MIAAKFQIGDRVEVVPNKSYGIISDVMFSNRCKANVYEVQYEKDRDEYGTFEVIDLRLAPKPREFSMDIRIDIAQNIVIATLYEDCGDMLKKPLRRGHGHIIHDGELGIAQAASYACKRLYDSLADSYSNGGNRHDY